MHDYGTPRVENPTRLEVVEAIGVNETAFQGASATRPTSFVTGIVDLTLRYRASSGSRSTSKTCF